MSLNFEITRFSCFTSSLGRGNSRNFTVFIRADWNFWARWCAASISSWLSPRAMMFFTLASYRAAYASRKAWIFHLV